MLVQPSVLLFTQLRNLGFKWTSVLRMHKTWYLLIVGHKLFKALLHYFVNYSMNNQNTRPNLNKVDLKIF